MKNIYIIILMVLVSSVLHAQNFKYGKISKEELEEKVHPLNKEANAAVLFRSQKTYYELDAKIGFTLITEVQERIKIYNKEGFDWATKEISYFRNDNDKEKVVNIKGETYNLIEGNIETEKLRKNGIFEEEVSNYKLKTKLAMPAVNEGSVIEYSYTIRSPFTKTIDLMPLQYTIPINKLEIEVRIPEFFSFLYHFNPRSPLPISVDVQNEMFTYNHSDMVRYGWNVVRAANVSSKIEFLQKIYEINNSNIPALKEEEFIDNIDNYAAYLIWDLQYTKFPDSTLENYASTWEGVTEHIFNEGLRRELKKTGFFEEDLDVLLSEVIEASAKAQTIYNYVRERVKWNNYLGYISENGIKDAYKEGEGNTGDINILLTAMLNYAGLEAYPVLVSTRNNGIPLFPTRMGYNYVVSGLSYNGELILLDASDPNLAFGELPYRARNWQGRIIREDNSSDWVNLMPKFQSQNLRTINFKFNEDLSLSGRCTKVFSGLEAKSYRDNFTPLHNDDYIKVLEKNKGNIVIQELKKQNEAVIGSDIKESYSFQLKDAVDKINDKIYFQPLLFPVWSENPFKAEERSYPIFFNYPKVEDNTINFMIPEGYEIEYLPESEIINFKNDALVFRYLVTQNGRFLRIEAFLDMKEIVFSPSEYNNLKDFFSRMVQKQSETIVLRKI